ncbi:MAG TPA: MBL fold metallo-hydrolase, partial [Tenuifilaceae bacterium]|nr:MBL fold metallo-hydrolase [Tenuifilaceae bacterium]
IHTPGHTPGSICLYLQNEKMLLTGDTLFYRSIGRTDLPGGSYDAIIRSITIKLMVLPDDVAVYPGHGESTTIGDERRSNPFIKT